MSFSVSQDAENPFEDVSHGLLNQPSTYQGEKYASNFASAERERAILAKEAELAAREAALNQQQEQIHKTIKPANWPPFYPIVHHDLEMDIPEVNRPLMRYMYKYWLGLVALLCWNMIACLTLLISHPSNMNNVASDFGVSLLYTALITFASFFLWFRPVYLAFQRNTALFFYVYLIFKGFHIAFSFYMAIGIPGSGSAGMINVIAVFSDSKPGAGIVCLIAFTGWIASGLVGLTLWKMVHSRNKKAGHTFQQAQAEAVGQGMRSGLAANLASQAI